jgi:antitoxin MazE
MTKTLTLKLVRVGNSRGVRLPKTLLDQYAIRDSVVAEERADGLLLRAGRDKKLSWTETAKEMLREKEDWSDFEAAVGDGLDPDERW